MKQYQDYQDESEYEISNLDQRFGVISFRNINEFIFYLSWYLMIIMTIINGNTYVAGLKYTIVPSILLVLSSFIVPRESEVKARYILAVLLMISATISSFNSDVYAPDSTYLNLIFSCIAYIVISSVTYDYFLRRKVIKFYINFATLICFIMCINYVVGYGFSVNNRISISYFGITKDVNYLTAFLVPGYACNIYRALIGDKKKSYVYSFIMIIAIFLSGSRSVFISAILATAIIILNLLISEQSFNKKVSITIILFFAVIIFFLLFQDNSLFTRMTTTTGYEDNARLTIWAYAMEAFYRRPLWGSGIYSGSYFALQNTKWITHNSFIDLLAGQGIIGAVIMALLYATILKVKKRNALFMMAYFVASFLPLFFVNGYECATFWIPMLLCTLLSDYCKEDNDILELIM